MKDQNKKQNKKEKLFDFEAYFKSEINAGNTSSVRPNRSTVNINHPRIQLSDYRRSQSRGFR